MSKFTEIELLKHLKEIYWADIKMIKEYGDYIFITFKDDELEERLEVSKIHKVHWSHPSKQHPPPEPQLEPCRYCGMNMIDKNYKTGYIIHPQNIKCPWSGSETIKDRWPKVKPTTEQSSAAPSLESLGIDPVKVWADAPVWVKTIELRQNKINKQFMPTLCGDYEGGSCRIKTLDYIKHPVGLGWEEWSWKRPEEKPVHPYASPKCSKCDGYGYLSKAGETISIKCPDCGGSGVVRQDVKVKCLNCGHEYNIDKNDTKRCPDCDSLNVREILNG